MNIGEGGNYSFSLGDTAQFRSVGDWIIKPIDDKTVSHYILTSQTGFLNAIFVVEINPRFEYSWSSSYNNWI